MTLEHLRDLLLPGLVGYQIKHGVTVADLFVDECGDLILRIPGRVDVMIAGGAVPVSASLAASRMSAVFATKPAIEPLSNRELGELLAEQGYRASSSRTVATLHKARRRLEIDLGDDAEADERETLHKIVDQALDILAGKRHSVCEPERFAIMRRADAAPQEAA